MSEIAPIGHERLPIMVSPIPPPHLKRLEAVAKPDLPTELGPVERLENRRKSGDEARMERFFLLTPETRRALLDLRAAEVA